MATGSRITDKVSRTYNSMSGCDIVATFGGYKIGELQAVSYTVTREKAPIYTMGSADCRGYTRGKRGIAGSLVFVMLDRSALLDTMVSNGLGTFMSDAEERHILAHRTQNSGNLATAGLGTDIPGLVSQDDIRQNYASLASAWYLDQIPPFNIVLNGVNEYGHAARMVIHNVEILNNGSGVSIDDILIDESMTFVCTNISPWQSERFVNPSDRLRF